MVLYATLSDIVVLWYGNLEIESINIEVYVLAVMVFEFNQI